MVYSDAKILNFYVVLKSASPLKFNAIAYVWLSKASKASTVKGGCDTLSVACS